MAAKILHIDIEKSWRGGQQQAVYLYESLLKKGIESNFICRKYSKLEEYFKVKMIPNININIISPYSLKNALIIARYAKKNNYNILHCHSSASLTIGILVKLFYRKVKIIGVRRVDFRINSTFKYNNSFVNKIVCISDAIKKVMIECNVKPDKTMVIHSGINLEKFANCNHENIINKFNLHNKFIIGTIAAIEDHKDYDTLIEAARIVTDKFREVVFLAVGSGSQFERISKLIIENKLSDKFILAGFRDNPGDFLKAFDLFVLSSKLEGLGTSILDAMSLGKAIVATDAGGIPEVVSNGRNGIVVEKQNPEILADAIIKLIENRELLQKYSNDSIKLVKNFDINITVEKNIQLYKQLLSL